MQVLITLPAVFVVYIVLWTIYTRFFHPYARIPGPFLASLSRLWLVRCVLGGKAQEVTRRLHKDHGGWLPCLVGLRKASLTSLRANRKNSTK